MRDPLEAQGVPQLAPPGDPLDGAPIVELEELLEDQQREQLRLGELVRALGAGVVGQGFLAGLQGHPRQRDRVFGRP